VKRNLAIFIIGLLVISYGQFMMPEMIETEECVEGVTKADTECSTYISGEEKNETRDPVRAGGFIVAVAGFFLLIGD